MGPSTAPCRETQQTPPEPLRAADNTHPRQRAGAAQHTRPTTAGGGAPNDPRIAATAATRAATATRTGTVTARAAVTAARTTTASAHTAVTASPHHHHHRHSPHRRHRSPHHHRLSPHRRHRKPAPATSRRVSLARAPTGIGPHVTAFLRRLRADVATSDIAPAAATAGPAAPASSPTDLGRRFVPRRAASARRSAWPSLSPSEARPGPPRLPKTPPPRSTRGGFSLNERGHHGRVGTATLSHIRYAWGPRRSPCELKDREGRQ
jgi:hypothetical protein